MIRRFFSSEPRAFGTALAFYGACYLAFFGRGLGSGFEIAPGDALDFGIATYLAPSTIWTVRIDVARWPPRALAASAIHALSPCCGRPLILPS